MRLITVQSYMYGAYYKELQGALPPETKKTQAYMFNNRIGNIKFLVATDAIGMGLNLNI